MKSLTLTLISLLLLSSCSQKENPEMTLRIQSLEQEIVALKTENDLLKAGGKSEMIQKSSTGGLDNTSPKIVEGSFSQCMKEAHEMYLTQSSEYCKKAGYTEEDMIANKCQLRNTIVKKIESAKVKAQSECYNLYQ